MPAVRVVDALRPARGSAIVQGADVTLDGDTRRTVMIPGSAVALASLDADGPRQQYRVTFMPENATGWRRVQIVRSIQVRKKSVPLPALTVDLAAGLPTIPMAPLETPAAGAALTVHAMMGTRATSVETEPFTVDVGALLTFDLGVRAIGARVPNRIGARVSVVEGGAARMLWRGTLSGSDHGWHPVRVPLAAYAGRRVRLRFTTRPGEEARSAGVLAVFGEPLVLAPRPRPPAFSNVVLVSMDTLRARSLGAYGSDRPTSPTLDAFAAEGVLFENAFSTAAFTLPGHLSMMSGLWFRTHAALGITAKLSPEHWTLAEVLQSAGYATGAFTSGAWIVPWAGFRRGFDVYAEQASQALQAQALPYEAFTRGLDWMRANAERPFFVFLHSYLVHMPYQPPAPYKTMFETLPAGAPEEERARLAYEQEVRFGDDQLRAFLEGLAALGVAERTLVIVTADHGEQFHEHGGSEHTHDLHDEVTHVPLVMRLPGAIPAGTRVAEPASLADIVPTVADLLGLPPVHGVDGVSLLPLAAGTATHLPRDGVFSEAESTPNLGWVDLAAVHTRAVSCIHDARRDTHECYDRRLDPWQAFRPLPPDDTSPEVLAAKASLARFTASKPPPTVGAPMGSAEPDAGEPATAKPAPGVETERREQLRALGYVE